MNAHDQPRARRDNHARPGTHHATDNQHINSSNPAKISLTTSTASDMPIPPGGLLRPIECEQPFEFGCDGFVAERVNADAVRSSWLERAEQRDRCS